MKNATGSKSARTPKAPKTAFVPTSEVRPDNGTVAVLPSPVDTPPPLKRGRKAKPEPTVATRPGASQAADAPEWARKAATRNTPAEMAAVPEVVPVAEPPTPKRDRPGKSGKEKPAASKAAPAPTPGSLRAIGNAWIESLRAAGHSKSTVASYGADLEVAYEVLDGNSAASGLTEKQIAAFNESKAVLKKKNGKAKAKPTILKTRRALRMALVWAAQKGLVKKAPFTAKTSA